LFKNTFDNPLPQQEIQSLQLLSMFGKAFFALCAITVEEPAANAPAQSPLTEEPDDTPYRRESLVRVLDADTGLAISNANLLLSVTEDERVYKFGRYKSDRLGQILLDYPPGKFSEIQFDLMPPEYLMLREIRRDPEGLLPAELVLRCKRLAPAPGDATGLQPILPDNLRSLDALPATGSSPKK
jgi:hypothetical protein